MQPRKCPKREASFYGATLECLANTNSSLKRKSVLISSSTILLEVSVCVCVCTIKDGTLLTPHNSPPMGQTWSYWPRCLFTQTAEDDEAKNVWRDRIYRHTHTHTNLRNKTRESGRRAQGGSRVNNNKPSTHALSPIGLHPFFK